MGADLSRPAALGRTVHLTGAGVGGGPTIHGTDRSGAAGRFPQLRRLDWSLLLAVLGLTLLGALLVWSATRQRMFDEGLDPQAFLKRHLLNIGIGLVLGGVAAVVDIRLLRAYAPVIYVTACAGLVAVLAFGTEINGANSWIVLGGGLQVQPAEFAKLGLVVLTAVVLGERRDRDAGPRDVDVVLVLGLAAVPFGLVMLQPDLGTVLVFAFILLGMLAVAGVRGVWIVGLLAAGVLVVVLSVRLGVLEEYQLDRFRTFADPTATDTRGAGYNAEQARIAIGSGGLTGKGLFEGTQTRGKFVPEQQTDFVFTVAGEELGLLGAGSIIVLLGWVLWRGMQIAARAPDMFGRLLAIGVVSWLGFQSFVNIGMTLGIMPVTGLPLPFVSYGGTAMFANLAAVGLLVNVHRRADAYAA